MGARSKRCLLGGDELRDNSRVPRWGHDQNAVLEPGAASLQIAECPDGGTIKTTSSISSASSVLIAECPDGGTIKTGLSRQRAA